jgi:ATP-dependent Clp protease ATP-binding subunit ClpA
VPFDFLPPEVVERVVEKFVLQLELQLADRNVEISLDEAAKAWLANEGYDRMYGARPLARVIQDQIKKPLADELLFGKLAKGGEVTVKLKDGELAFEITPHAPKPAQKNATGPATDGKKKEPVK